MGGFFKMHVSQDLVLEELGREVVIFVRGILSCMQNTLVSCDLTSNPRPLRTQHYPYPCRYESK